MGQGGYPRNQETRFKNAEVKIGCARFGLNAALGTDVVLGGGGTSASPVVDATASPKFLSFYVSSTALTGSGRGLYLRYYTLSGGEAGRFYTTLSDDTPTDTVNGVHCSLDFGSAAGNVTGQGSAGRFTLSVPASRTLGGTTAAIQADLDLAGTGGTIAHLSNAAFIRMTAMGAGKASVDDEACLFNLDGVTEGDAHLFVLHAPTGLVGHLRVKVAGTLYYLPLYSTTTTS